MRDFSLLDLTHWQRRRSTPAPTSQFFIKLHQEHLLSSQIFLRLAIKVEVCHCLFTMSMQPSSGFFLVRPAAFNNQHDNGVCPMFFSVIGAIQMRYDDLLSYSYCNLLKFTYNSFVTFYIFYCIELYFVQFTQTTA